MEEINATHLCLVTAVDLEFKIATELLTARIFSSEDRVQVCRGQVGRRQVTVLKSEMGAIGFADRLAHHLERNRYDALVMAGLAGALDPKLKIGDAVVFNLCHHARSSPAWPNSREKPPDREENASINCDNKISGLVIENLRASGLPGILGAGVTVSQIVTNAGDKVRLGRQYRALAVDMETYEILTVCAARGLPATALRVVSDEAQTDLPDFNRALRPDGRMSGWGIGSAMLMSPLRSVRFLLGMKRVVGAFRASLKAVLWT